MTRKYINKILERKGALWLPFLFAFLVFNAKGQVNLSGKSGLLYIPDANFVQDGKISFGYNFNPIGYSLRYNKKNPEGVMYANIVILPRFDVSLCLVQPFSNDQYKRTETIGDRQLDVRYLILKETKKRPSLAVAMSSPFTIDAAMLTQVIVATKHFKLGEKLILETTAGYGSPYFVYRHEHYLTNSNIFSNFRFQKKSEYKYKNGYLEGPFGGVKLDFQKKAGLMVEWDSQKLNMGAYGIIGKRWTVQAGLLNFDQVMFGSSFAVDLFKPTRKIEKLYE